MTGQLFDNDRIECPGCGYCPADEEQTLAHDTHKTICEQLEAFDVAGAEDGHVFCPECSLEFPVRDHFAGEA